ncbi:hypothetical protein PT974_07569 [Cladobotryum mycophilum]|uniref:Non-reducing end beta-L-arabinofuranosidase-like GH127 middle domain-containing protein n=1 Tax=Cladobotryum mycophilum TaxID=491253 RepID=A0ABR0SQ03_9HYPO
MKLTLIAAAAAQLPLGAIGAALNSRTLQPWAYSPLPVGAVKPQGWLLGEMKAMANGLAGHEYDFYVYVNQSSWLNVPGTGGTEYSSLNEALPYWFNGLVPMAYELDDARLKKQVQDVADTVLGHQADDGWIGPEVGEARNFWARTPLFLGLTQLVEADQSWESRVVTALRRFMTLANKMLKNNSQGYANCPNYIDCTWGQARVHDLMITIQWMLEKYPSDQDSILWENMDIFYSQSNFKWDQWYTEGRFPQVANPGDGSIWPYIHGVNVGQGLKFPSVIYRINGSSTMVQKGRDAVNWSFQYHGSSSGSILADEHERDLSSFIGSELCTAVETSYSLAYMYQVHGESSYADRAERTIFNALPVMMTGDKWAHQYMASPNQPFALNTTQSNGNVPPVFTTANSGVATTFGMEPLYPCCTVNHPQGYPKFTSNSWGAVGRGGLAHTLLSPSSVTTTVNGGSVTITCDTNYPFTNTLVYTVKTSKDFDLYLRMPEWSNRGSSKLSLKGSTPSSVSISSDSTSGMAHIPIRAGATQVTYVIVTDIRTEQRPGNTISVFYGNLLYALDVGFKQTSSLPHASWDPKGPGIDGLPFKQLRDYYYSATEPWNIAIDPSTLKYHGISPNANLPEPIFEQNAPPNFISVDGCEISGWNLYMGVTPDVPPTSVKCSGKRKTYKLIPYGAAKVHMSELPVIKF